MSMVLTLFAARDETIARVLADPPLVWLLVAPDDPDAYADARRRTQRGGLLSRLLGRRLQTENATLTVSPDEGELADLDKAWHGIHFLLTRSAGDGAPPLNFLLAGGEEVVGEEVGYCAPRAYRASQVTEIEAALARVSDDELRQRFEPLAMMQASVYPEIWDRPVAEDDSLGYLMEYSAVLRTALRTLATRSYGMFVALS